jgi:hypothetical protein
MRPQLPDSFNRQRAGAPSPNHCPKRNRPAIPLPHRGKDGRLKVFGLLPGSGTALPAISA